MKIFKTGKIFNSIFLFFIFSALFFASCGKSDEAPPDAIITEAKNYSMAVMDSVRMATDQIKSKPNLVDEYYDQDNRRYVLEYHVVTRFGSTVTKSPKAYISKKDGGWHYHFQFGQVYDFQLGQK